MALTWLPRGHYLKGTVLERELVKQGLSELSSNAKGEIVEMVDHYVHTVVLVAAKNRKGFRVNSIKAMKHDILEALALSYAQDQP